MWNLGSGGGDNKVDLSGGGAMQAFGHFPSSQWLPHGDTASQPLHHSQMRLNASIIT